jgi:hypothetical protein
MALQEAAYIYISRLRVKQRDQAKCKQIRSFWEAKCKWKAANTCARQFFAVKQRGELRHRTVTVHTVRCTACWTVPTDRVDTITYWTCNAPLMLYVESITRTVSSDTSLISQMSIAKVRCQHLAQGA